MLKQRTKNYLACIMLGLLICTIIISAPGCIKVTLSPSASGPSTPSSLPQTIQPAPAQSASIIITAFIADPPSITAGNSSKLSWNVSGAEFVNIDPGIGRVDLSAEIMVSPVVTTVYTLTAGNASNTVIASVQVIVSQPSPAITAVSGLPLIHFFSAEPQVINTGESSTISWNVSNAEEIIITPAVFRQLGTIPASGSGPVGPSVTTSYTLTATNAIGSIHATVTITVNALPAFKDWSGTWQTDWGIMQLTQSNGQVTGTYEHDNGKILGYISKNLSGNILVGTWSEQPAYAPPSDAGDIEWTMAPDFNSFTGQWRYGSDGDWDGNWVGKRLSP